MATQRDNWELVKALFEAALEEDSANRFIISRLHIPDVRDNHFGIGFSWSLTLYVMFYFKLVTS